MPAITGTLQGSDTANFIVTYDTKNNGTNKMLTPSGSVNDGNGGANYSYTFVTSANGTIYKTNITVTAQDDLKYYDGTTASSLLPTTSVDVTLFGDMNNFSQTFDSKNVGTSKSLIPSGTVTDAGGNASTNYTYTFANSNGGEIDQNPNLTINAVANTKIYDGTTSAAAVPAGVGLQPGDTVTGAEVYADRNVGTGKTLNVSTYIISDGNGGANYYSPVVVPFTGGVITATNLTITAQVNVKNYDGTTNSATTATITFGGIQTGDSTPIWTQFYANKNVGTNKTLTPATLVVSDGNGGANYSYTYMPASVGLINATNLTVTAVTDTKTYDGTTNSSAKPILSVPLQPGDTTNSLTQTFLNKNVGLGNRTLAPAISINDGNGGTNYNIYFVNFTTGTINPATSTATVTVNNSPVVYNGSGQAATVTLSGTNTAGSVQNLMTGEAATQTAAGTYAVTADFVPTDTNFTTLTGLSAGNFIIGQATSSITLDTTTNFIYNATGQTPTNVVTGSTGERRTNYYGVTVSYNGTTAPTNAGTYALTNAVVSDGNWAGATNGLQFTIAKAALTLVPTTNVKIYDGTTSATNVPEATGLQGNDTVNGTMVIYADKNAGTDKLLTVSAYTVNDGSNGSNYTVTLNESTGGTINFATPTATLTVGNSPTVYNGLPQAAIVNISSSSVQGMLSNIEYNGSTNVPTAAGTYSITANFVPADTNHMTLTGLSAGNFVITLTPMLRDLTVTRLYGKLLKIALTSLQTNWTTVPGDVITVVDADATSTNGSTLTAVGWVPGVGIATTNSGFSIAYISYPANGPANDAFTYSIRGSNHVTVSGTVHVSVNYAAQVGSVASLSVSGNAAVVNFLGHPGNHYNVQRSSPSPNSFTNIATILMPVTGYYQFTDSSAPNGSAYYRLSWDPTNP